MIRNRQRFSFRPSLTNTNIRCRAEQKVLYRLTSLSRSDSIAWIQPKRSENGKVSSSKQMEPCSNRFLMARMSTSATMAMQPVMTPAFPCAPDIPPKPEVTKTFGWGNSSVIKHDTLFVRSELPKYLRPALRTVRTLTYEGKGKRIYPYVPCTIPCGPM